MGFSELDCEWRGRHLRVRTFGGFRVKRQLWVGSVLVDEERSMPLSFRCPLLCARVEIDGAQYDIDVVRRSPGTASATPPLKILVDGEVVHGDASGSPQSLVEPSVWARVRSRGVWAYVLAESPKGILLLCPAVVAVVLLNLEIKTTVLLGLALTCLALVGVPLITWQRNEWRWRARAQRLNTPRKLGATELQRPLDAA